MTPLDPTSLALFALLLTIAMAIGFSLIHRVLRRQPVLRLWTASLWLSAAGVCLMAARPYMPELVSILAGNACIATADLLLLVGIARHVDARCPWWQPVLLGTAFMVVIAVFSMAWPNLAVRLAAYAAMQLIRDVWVVALLLKAPTDLRTSTRLAALAFIADAVFSLARLVVSFSENPGIQDIFQAGTGLAISFLCVILLGLAQCFSLLLLLVERLMVDLKKAASTDGLTSLLNRNALLERARRQLQPGHPSAVLMIDMDHFKQINDTWGHRAGDDVLRHFARALQDATQAPEALIGRYGGEEFVVILPDTELTVAMALATRLRDALSHNPVRIQNQWIRNTVSIGLAIGQGMEDLDTLLARADKALYQAKADGRDRVVASAPHTVIEGKSMLSECPDGFPS